jgi:Tol biopolymer transport system component
LTDTPEFTETSPAWSPDGREIAFLRAGAGVFVVSESGEDERRIAGSGTWVRWTADRESVLVRDREADEPYAIFEVFLDGRKRRQITRPRGGDGDWRFNVSPDGSSIAFTRFDASIGELYICSFEGGEPRRVTNWNDRSLSDVVWTPDGRELVYSRDDGLWRIDAHFPRPGRGWRFAELPSSNLSTSRSGSAQRVRLAIQSPKRELSFQIIDLTAPLYQGVFRAAKPFPNSVRLETPGPFSPDSRSFAFVAGNPPRLSTANADGANARPLVADARLSQLTPGSWSPDGTKIVFDAVIHGNRDIFSVDTSGGKPRRLTFEPSDDGAASWSHDGRRVYFSSNRAGEIPDVWRMPADGGAAVRITHHGGLEPRESPDGKFLYYIDRPAPATRIRETGTARLMRVPVSGGEETSLRDGLTPFWWSMTNSAIFLLTREAEFDAIDRYDLLDGNVTRVGRLASSLGLFAGQFSVSPDHHWALLAQRRGESELMLLDGFR